MTDDVSTTEKLSKDAEALSDEELVERLRQHTYTRLAEDVFQRELVARGVDVGRALAESPRVGPPSRWALFFQPVKARAVLSRVLRFPIRAVLGVEPLWTIYVFGGIGIVAIEQLTVHGLTALVLIRPAPPYVLPVAYSALAFFAVAATWLGIALWQTGGRAKSRLWIFLSRAVALWCLLIAVKGTMNAMEIVEAEASQSGGVLNGAPRR